MIRVRSAQRADLAALAQLEVAVFQQHGYPAFFFRQALDCWPNGLLVAEGRSGPVGYALWVPADVKSQDAWLLSLAVSIEARGQGIARNLLAKVMADTRSFRRLLLTVDPGNQAALALYLSEGFTTIARDESYFTVQESRLVLARAT